MSEVRTWVHLNGELLLDIALLRSLNDYVHDDMSLAEEALQAKTLH